MFKQPWDLNSSKVFPFYVGLLLSGNAVQAAAVLLASCQASAAMQLNNSVFWDVTRLVLVFIHRSFGATHMGPTVCS